MINREELIPQIYFLKYILYGLNNPIRYYDPLGLCKGGWIKRLWRKLWGPSTTEEAVCSADEHSCAEKYYYCEDDCVKCCEKTFPVATPDPTGACSTKRNECIANCMDVTAGICVPPPQSDENGQK